MRRKLFRLFFIVVAMDLLIACCCHCDDDEFYFSHCEIEAFHLDNTNEDPVLIEEFASKAAYGIRTRVTLIENSCALNRQASFLFSTAYATSCDCPQNYFLTEDIISIEIVTLNDFDSSHPANSDVSDYFKVFRANEYQSIADFITNRANTQWDSPFDIDMFLLQPPLGDETSQFLVRIVLSDDRVLEKITSTITLI